MMTDHFPEQPMCSTSPALDLLAERVAALEATVTEHAAALGPTSTAVRGGQVVDSLRTVWDRTPVAVRLAFVRAALPVDHPRQGALSEAVTLVDLAGSANGLIAWIESYPAVFAEASAGLAAPAASRPEDDEDRLACEILTVARELTARAMATAGVAWISPAVGEPITGDCEVIGEASSSEVAAGRVHTLRRPGFRRNGKVELRAQVLRAVPGPVAEVAERAPAAQMPPASPVPEVSSGRVPEWLSELQGRAVGPGTAARSLTAGLLRLASAGSATCDEDVCGALEPLLPLLGAGWSTALAEIPGEWLEEFARQRPRLEEWLRNEFGVVVVAPREGEAFDAATMEATGERRTAHAHERGTVARVHRAGLNGTRGVLVRAQVSRYSLGGAA